MTTTKIKTRVFGPVFFDMLFKISKECFVPMEKEPGIQALNRYVQLKPLLYVTLSERGIVVREENHSIGFREVTPKEFSETAIEMFA